MREKVAYSVAEAAAALGISKSQVYRAIENGVFPCVRLGAKKLIPCGALDAFMSGNHSPEQLNEALSARKTEGGEV